MLTRLSPSSLLLKPLCIAVTAGVLLLPAGCNRPMLADASDIIRSLEQATSTLTQLEQQDADLLPSLARILLDIAHERLQTRIALDFDALLGPDGQPASDAVDRLTSPNESNVLTDEIRTGRLTPPQALTLIQDFAAAQSLTPDSRLAVERQITDGLLPVVEFNAQRQSIQEAIARNASNRAALLDELRALVEALDKAANATARVAPPPGRALHGVVNHFVDDQPLAQSINTLIDTIANDPSAKGGNQ